MNTKNQNEEEELKQNQAANEETEAQAEETQNKEEGNEELTNEQKLEKELEAANKTIEEQKDKYLRLSAEFDNYRKRTMKEKAELIKNGGEKTISAILPILDDMERALQNAQKSEDIQAVCEGIELISQKARRAGENGTGRRSIRYGFPRSGSIGACPKRRAKRKSIGLRTDRI